MIAVKLAISCFIIMSLISTGFYAEVQAQGSGIDLSIVVSTQKRSYYYREPIQLTGDFVQNGQLVSNGTVGVAVYTTGSTPLPIAYRAVKTGSFQGNYPIDFVELTPCDQNGVPTYSFLPSQTLWVKFTIKNYDPVDHYQFTTLTLFDANGVPLATREASLGIIPAGTSPSTFFMGPVIPMSAQPGNATLIGCIFSDNPKNGGVPYSAERKTNFEIKRNPQLNYTTPPMSDPSAPSGFFASSLKFTNELAPGDYQAYVGARSTLTNGTQISLVTVQNVTTFSILNAKMPPQAAFTYYPVDSYVGMVITFDASASTAEGYGVSLVNYQWDFGNGTKYSTATPTITNVFSPANNYTVTLNVTDSQGLWSTTTKIVSILPPTGPTPNFIWSPPVPSNSSAVVFDASSTTLGWNGTSHPAITNYVWNFGDGNVTSSGNNPQIVHKFATDGNYTVQLNVTDAGGFNGYVSKIVQVRRGGLAGDINGDGVVDIYDAIVLASAFNSTPSSPNWNPNADINHDGSVDIYDAIILASNFNKTG
jgi:PKD repeat protein